MDHPPDDAALAARALAGDQQAFDVLRAGAERAVRGYLRVRVRHDDDVDDLLQETWLQVWQKLPTYDPGRARFVSFARYWADILVRRYWDTAQGRGVEIPVSAGVGAVGDDEDAALGDVFDRLRGDVVISCPLLPDDPVDAEVYDTLLTITFATNSPPHQLIVFGLVKAADWKPRRIAGELSNVPLRALASRLEATYREQSEQPPERIAPAFAPLRARLGLHFAEAVRDPTTLATYPALHSRVVGDTELADYYTGDPTADVTQWWYAVKRRVLAEIQRQTDGPLVALLRQAQRRPARPAGARRGEG